MRQLNSSYIAGEWRTTSISDTLPLTNPATGNVSRHLALAGPADVDAAVNAARATFGEFSRTSPHWRAQLLRSITTEYARRVAELAEAVTDEIGAPTRLAHGLQVGLGKAHFDIAADSLGTFTFIETRSSTRILREPIGVCGLITPWNWPLNQMACKIAPAIAAGCTMVLKPSEITPATANILAEIMHAAGVPAGVFNMVHGMGTTAGSALASHPDIDMVSITGSRAAGIDVAISAAATVKRVHQELGGKSPFIVLDDAVFQAAVEACMAAAMNNSGQSCNAPTRLLVPEHRATEAADLCRHLAGSLTVGEPRSGAGIGPVASRKQWTRIQSYLETGVAEGARIVAGGPGMPADLARGFYVKPTVFAGVENHMTIAREEIFGPVLSIISYRTVDHALRIANDTTYGLAAYVWGQDNDLVEALVMGLRAGQIRVNGAPGDLSAPFGGYKQSGNGREWGQTAIAEYLELKSVMNRQPTEP